jgi:hypothetical protein
MTIPDTNPEFVPSTSDQRVTNNVMRHEYRVLTEGEKFNMKQIKDMGLLFIEFCDEIRPVSVGPNGEAVRTGSRELSLAKTKMEEAVMWAVKSITK